jgi:hypothetical protein
MFIMKKPFQSHVKSIQFIHLSDSPQGFSAMPPYCTLVTVVAERHRGVLLALVDVVGGARGWGVADRAGQALDPLEVLALGCIQFVVHRFVKLFS